MSTNITTFVAINMKQSKVYFLTLTILIVNMLFISCKNSAKNDTQNTLKALNIARAANDYSSSTVLLTQLFAQDSVQFAWAADTLAYYHYVNAIANNEIGELNAAKYFVEQGLKINDKDDLLHILKAQCAMLESKDSLAFAVLENQYDKSKNPSLPFFIASAYIAAGKAAKVDSLITAGINAPDSISTKMYVQDMMNRSWQPVPKKAVFQFLKANALLATSRDQLGAARQSLQLLADCLRIDPAYTMAQNSIAQLQQSLMQAGIR